jgi:integrase
MTFGGVVPKRVKFGDFSIYQRATKRNGGTTIRWYGDFRSLGGGQKALTPRLIGDAGPQRGVETRREAKAIATEYARLLREGGRGLGGTNRVRAVPTFQQYADRHVAALRDRPKRSGRARSDSYVRDTKSQLKYAADFFGPDRPLASISHAEVADYLDRLHRRDITPRTVEAFLRSLDQMLRRALAEQIISANPVDAVRTEIPAGRTTRTRTALEADQAWSLLKAAEEYDTQTGHYMHALASLLLHAGLRWNEARALRVGDVRYASKGAGPEARGGTPNSEGVIAVAPNRWRDLKTEGSEREVPLWPDLSNALASLVADRHPDAPLFPSPRMRGRPVHSVRRAWNSVRDKAELPKWVDFHTCRHTYASARIQTAEGGQPVSTFTVARELGHRSTLMVEQRYGHLLRDRSVRRSVVSYRPAPIVDVHEGVS